MTLGDIEGSIFAVTRKLVVRLIIVIALAASSPAFAAEQPSGIPAWLTPYVGEGEGQIARVVLQRARALYFQKLHAGAIRNSCYFAMDATHPHDLGDGKVGRRFYVICESSRSFRAISAGHGGGRVLEGIANFANGKRCAKNFGNALGSFLTAGGAYVTGETITSFKGYYRASAKQDAALIRSFVQFDVRAKPQTPDSARSAAMRRNCCATSVFEKIRTALMRTARAMFRSDSWKNTPTAVAMAAPVGRRRTLDKSSPW